MRRFPLLALLLITNLSTVWGLRAADWKLVWSDEFDKPGPPDCSKWGYEEGFLRNQEEQCYTRERAENARVEDGVLVLEGRQEAFPAQDGKHPARYTSASLTIMY